MVQLPEFGSNGEGTNDLKITVIDPKELPLQNREICAEIYIFLCDNPNFSFSTRTLIGILSETFKATITFSFVTKCCKSLAARGRISCIPQLIGERCNTSNTWAAKERPAILYEGIEFNIMREMITQRKIIANDTD